MSVKLDSEDMPSGVTKVSLAGRMDIEGAQSVDMRFNVLAGAKKLLVVDMTGVDFIASMGVRTLMQCARTVRGKGGKIAISGAQPGVLKVLETTGMDEAAVLKPTFDEAVAAITA
jgi:anti-sigma B factor antagonist